MIVTVRGGTSSPSSLGTLPWTFVALRHFMPAWRLDAQEHGLQPRRFLMLWVGVVIGFFSLSHSKLAPYIVPVIPMFGMLLGDLFTRLSSDILRRHLLIAGGVVGLLGVAVLFLPDNIAGSKSIDVVADLRPETAIGFLLIAATLLCTCLLAPEDLEHR
jgi:4-amino-4-deoxy-L-arabinose transferase-like glycosyltransferase